MLTLEAMKQRIISAQDLLSVVRTMKILAAINIHHYEKAVVSLAEYNRTVLLGMQILLRQRPEAITQVRPERGQHTGAIIFGSDQGMCGQLNDQIVSFALTQLQEVSPNPADRLLLAAGARVSVRLANAGQPVAEYLTVPSSIPGITTLVQEVMLKVDEWRAQHSVDQLFLFHHQPLRGATYRPRMVQLLPVDPMLFRHLRQRPWPTRMLPTFTMQWQPLLTALMRQYLFVSLYRAIAESLASENASRLSAMQTAEKKISERLTDLQLDYHQHRQSSITEELLDIVAGFEALTAEAQRMR